MEEKKTPKAKQKKGQLEDRRDEGKSIEAQTG